MPLPPATEKALFLHNPRCSKSRAVKALLEEHGIDHEERLYLEDPLDRGELEDLARRLGRPAGEWVRRKESAWAETGLGADADEASVLDAIAAAPILMERPVVVRGERAAIGRPPEDVLALFDRTGS